jgi:manganese/zinc/iron transport system substrate-binding protein
MRFLLIAFLLFFSCHEQNPKEKRWYQPNGKIKILATVMPVAEIVCEIAKDEGEVITLIGDELDPHSYQIVKGDREKIDSADLLFACGVSLEHNAGLQIALASSSKTVFLGEKIWEAFPERGIFWMGQKDPHLWHDPSLWAEAIPFIVERLSWLRPEKKEYFTKNGEAYRARLIDLYQEIASLLQSIPEERRYLVTSHDAFNYFSRAFLGEEEWQKRVASPEGLAPDSQISFQDLNKVIEFIEKHQVEVLFFESNVSTDALRKIHSTVEEKGRGIRLAKSPLYGDSIGFLHEEGGGYEKMVRHNAAVIYEEIMGR